MTGIVVSILWFRAINFLLLNLTHKLNVCVSTLYTANCKNDVFPSSAGVPVVSTEWQVWPAKQTLPPVGYHPSLSLTAWFSHCMVLSLYGSLTAWLSHCVVLSLHGSLTAWFSHCMVLSLHGSLTAWFSHCMVLSLHGSLTAWFSHCMVLSLHGSLTAWFSHCMVLSLSLRMLPGLTCILLYNV